MKKSPITFDSKSENPNLPGVIDITAEEFAHKTSQVHVIDVRRPEEFTGELGHINEARLMTLDTLPDVIEQLPKDEPIVFVCLSGGRSARATAFAQTHGFQHVFNLQGGMKRWTDLSLPVVR